MPSKPKHHHKTGKPSHVGRHYLKVYYPYIPLLIIVLIGLLVGRPFTSRPKTGLLAYATSINTPDLLAATNAERSAFGRQTLQLNAELNQAAQAKANDMASRNYWSHNTPDGQPPWNFIDRTGYAYQKAGENLAYGFSTSTDTVTGWMNSPSHRENILDSAYKEVGFGFASAKNYQNSGPETIVVAMYGLPLSDTATLFNSPFNYQLATTADAKTQAVAEPGPQVIGQAQLLTKGQAPWISVALSLFSGFAIAFLVLRHWLGIRRFMKRGERLLLAHPMLDVILISLVVFAWTLGREVGVIR